MVDDRAVVEELALEVRVRHADCASGGVDGGDAEMVDQRVRSGVVADRDHRADELEHAQPRAVRLLRHEIRAPDQVRAVCDKLLRECARRAGLAVEGR